MKTETTSSVKENALKYIDILLIVGLFATALAGLVLGEKIQINQGFGFDGEYYAEYAHGFETALAQRLIGSYQIQRILPSGIVHYALQSLAIPFTPVNLIMAFGMLNVISLTASAWAWCQISNHLKMSLYAKLGGFICLFANYAVLKLAAYSPVLTDIPAYALGVLALLFCLKGFRAGLYLLIPIGAFTWPPVAYECILLLLFPRPAAQPSFTPPRIVNAALRFMRNYLRTTLLVLVILSAAAWLLLQILPGSLFLEQQITRAYHDPDAWLAPFMQSSSRIPLSYYLQKGQQMYRLLTQAMLFLFLAALSAWVFTWLVRRYSLPAHSAIALLVTLAVAAGIGLWFGERDMVLLLVIKPIVPLLPLSIVAVLWYIFKGFQGLWHSPQLYDWSYWLQGFRWQSLILIVFMLLAISALQASLSGPQQTAVYGIKATLLWPLVAPAKFIVAHVAYFGPFVLLIVFLWKKVCRCMSEYGGGWILAASLALILSLNTESRALINFVPLFVPPLAQALDTHCHLSAKKVGLFALLSLLVSRFWFPMGGAPRSWDLDIFNPPDLFYFMNAGPWMTHEVYWVLAAATVVLGILICKVFGLRMTRDVHSKSGGV